MANNKAFVRYANNKAVPGSLIVRKKAPSVGTWKEVSYDLCCENIGGNCLYGASFYECVGTIEPVCDVYSTRTYYSNYDMQNNIVCNPESVASLIDISVYEDINGSINMPDGSYLNVPVGFLITIVNGVIIDAACA